MAQLSWAFARLRRHFRDLRRYGGECHRPVNRPSRNMDHRHALGPQQLSQLLNQPTRIVVRPLDQFGDGVTRLAGL